MKKKKADRWAGVWIDRNQLPQHSIDTSPRRGSLSSRRAVPLPLNQEVVYIDQYVVKAQEAAVDPKQLVTVKTLPFIAHLDPRTTAFSVSFLSDPVALREGVNDRRSKPSCARIAVC